jgi:hypothetical protein
MRGFWVAVCGAIVLATAAVGSAQATLTPAGWARKADAICAVGNAKIRALGHPTTFAATLRAVDRQIYWTKWQADRIRALPAPATRAATARLMLREIDTVVALWRRALTALKTRRVAAAADFVARSRPHVAAANAAARRLGAQTCAATS